MSLKGNVAIVTGATRGIGRAIALTLAREGVDIAFTYRQSKDQADSLVKEIKKIGTKAHAAQVDVSDFGACKHFIEDVKEKLGKLNILINNAGIVRDKALMLMEQADWDEVIATNLNGVFNMSRSSIVTFLKQKSGTIVNMTSISGIVGTPRQTNYSASKGGIIGFTKSLAKEVAGYNVRVNAVAPGYVETDMLNTVKEDQKKKLEEMIPFKRFGNVEEISSVVAFLVSEKSGYITGQVIIVDGGLAMR
ncbi:3-oxoacyl-[acyl-carrier-protein] reductase [Candidatus Omnitrophota bacterium]